MSTLLVGWEHVDKNDVAFILLNKRGYLLRVHNTPALWEEQGEVRAYKPSTLEAVTGRSQAQGQPELHMNSRPTQFV